MLEEKTGAMEKKVSSRQSLCQSKNGSVTCERKSDFPTSRHGRGRGPRGNSNGAAKVLDVARPNPVQKMDRSFGDSRQRQRICYDYRQREEIVEGDDAFDVLSTSRKGNANHLLNFKFYPRHNHDEQRWYDRSSFNNRGGGGYKKKTTKLYKKERFLQASCQFVVRDTGDYTEQAINSDALVDWNMIELVRSYSTEPVTCPICLQVPYAGKITKCGHTYCWSCILHYLHLGEKEARKCPICYDSVEGDDLKSVQWIDVPDYRVGDEIEFRLMRKAKGSVFTMPKDNWQDRQGKPMNIEDGVNTKYMKLLVASCDQIQKDVIESERSALKLQIQDAEEYETCFIQMALELLMAREASLKLVFLESLKKDKYKVNIPGLSSSEVEKAAGKLDQETKSATIETAATCYVDAFDDKIRQDLGEDENTVCEIYEDKDVAIASLTGESSTLDDVDDDYDSNEVSSRYRHDSETSLPFGSPNIPFPLVHDQEVNPVTLSIEETAEHLELPMDLLITENKQSKKSYNLNTKDTYYFYQASSGQHIYLNSLNAQCLSKEYGSLEDSPSTIKATIVAIERIFMTEDVRKRLRYLDHIPLTCEFHVVELKLKPPVVSKETLKCFEVAFEKKRKSRQQREREDKRRAKKFELEHRKSLGFYPEVQIPLDNLSQFPSHLSTSLTDDDLPALSVASSLTGAEGYQKDSASNSQRSRNDSTTSDDSLGGSMSFAQMLRAGKTTPQTGGKWGKVNPTQTLTTQASITRSRHGDEEDSDGGLPAPSYSESMSDAIAKALDGINLRHSTDDPTQESKSGGGRKKKKEKQSRKEKQILFSTSMARKS